MGISINGGTPIAGWFFVMENPIKMDDYQYDWGNNHPASSSIIQLLTGYRLGTLWFWFITIYIYLAIENF